MSLLGIGGPGQSSSKTSNTSTQQTNSSSGAGPATNLNFAGIGGGKKSKTNISIEMGDFGAIEAGTNLAKLALTQGISGMASSLDAVTGLSNSVIDKTLNIASKNQTSESAQFQDTLLKLALVGGAAVVLFAFVKRGG